jgi:hypothetical protein
MSILVTKSSISNDVYGIIYIPPKTTLIFADEAINLKTMGIKVSGKLIIGTPTCRIKSNIMIELFGKKPKDPSLSDPWVKGIYVEGVLDIHAQIFAPAWTRLAITANVGDMIIYVQDKLYWKIGQTITITTTIIKDSLDYHQNEVRTIKNILNAPNLGKSITAIFLDKPLLYSHYGGKEYQAEVALLSRNIKVVGNNAALNFVENQVCSAIGISRSSTYPCAAPEGYGGHIMVIGKGIGRASGVELEFMGQTNVLGRYPFHFHQTFDNGVNSYFNDGSIHHSFYRGISIHGTNNVTISGNVAFNITGHCYYLEDGVEENNIIEYNFGSFVHFLGDPTTPSLFNSQYLNDYNSTENCLVPSDVTASVFYIPNAYNSFIGNAASGGWR